MDEDFLDVTQTSSKKVIIVFFIFIIFLLIAGYIFVYRPHHFGVKNLTVEVGSELSKDINDYLNTPVIDTSIYKLNLNKVKINEVGIYEYTVAINKNVVKGKIKIVDTIAPEFVIKENYQIEQDDDYFFIGDVLESCTDISLPCIVSYKKDKDANFIKELGLHTFTIVISDIYKNKKEALVTIEVLKKGSIVREEELDLEFANSSTEIPGFNNEYYIKLDKAIKSDSDEISDIANEISADKIQEYLKINYPNNTIKNSEIVLMYNKSQYVIGLVVKITLNNDKIIYMPKDSEE